MELLTHKVDDGPEIVALHDASAFTMSLGWFVKTGARDETPNIAGVSHFLEHMVFKGTARRTAQQVNHELDHLGAQSNAYTSEDATVFYASVLPECQTQAVDLLTDLMQPTIADDEFETERQVVLEEIAMYDDQPPYGAFERLSELFFGEHPLATRILGTEETVGDLTAAQMREYHRSRYTSDNMILIASGKIDFDAMVEQVSAFATDWPAVASRSRSEVPVFGSGEVTIDRESTHQHYQVMAWPGVHRSDLDRYALRMLCTILADDSGSRLFWELIDTGRAETAAIWPQMFDDCGCLLGYMCCAPEDAEDNAQVFQQVITQACEDGVLEKEIELARKKISASLILSDEKPSNRLFAVGQSWMNRGSYEPLDVVLSRYAAVTQADILRVARETLAKPKVCVKVVGT
ncbi:MAG: pitrilysin family protein [Aureliella sp.]